MGWLLSVRRTRAAGRRPEFPFEAVEQIEETDALPGTVSAPDCSLPEHARLLESPDRLACPLFCTSQQLRGGLNVHDRLRRQ
jgi:hypothetical protein